MENQAWEIMATSTSPPLARPVSPSAGMAGMAGKAPCTKVLKGQPLSGPHCWYDVDSQSPGDTPPHHLDVLPISVYGRDPALVAGRQIAVNRRYICYCLRPGSIRVLSRNAPIRALLQGHSQRVTDMAFYADNVHLLASASSDGRVLVWNIMEVQSPTGKAAISEQLMLAMHFIGEWKEAHSCVCWNPHSQDCLLVGIGKHVLRIDFSEVKKKVTPSSFTIEKPLQCKISNCISGVYCYGGHDEDVTGLSVIWRDTLYIASASKDGTVRVWGEKKMQPLAVFCPYDGEPVSSVSFMSTMNQSHHTVLLTGGPSNHILKLWVPTNGEASLSSNMWRSIQTLELKSSTEARVECAFFNQVCVVPQAGLILLGNAKKNALYSIHIDLGSSPCAVQMDYLVELLMAMPILSLTAMAESVAANGKGIVEVFCVQTQVIQEYFLNLSICIPPQSKDSNNTDTFTRSTSSDSRPEDSLKSVDRETHLSKLAATEAQTSSTRPTLVFEHGVRPDSGGAGFGSWVEVPEWVAVPVVVNKASKLGAWELLNQSSSSTLSSPPPPPPPSLLSRTPSPKPYLSIEEKKSNEKQAMTSRSPDSDKSIPTGDELPKGQVAPLAQSRLITPSDIISLVASAGSANMDAGAGSQVSEKSSEIGGKESSSITSISSGRNEFESKLSESKQIHEEEVQREVPEGSTSLLPVGGKRKKTKNKTGGSTVPLNADTQTPLLTENKPLDAVVREHQESLSSPNAFEEIARQVKSMQELISQCRTFQMGLQKEASMSVAPCMAREAKRAESALGQSLEKCFKTCTNEFWNRFEEYDKKREELQHARAEQMSAIISDFASKDLCSGFDRYINNEIASFGSQIAQSTSPNLESAISATINDNFQVLQERIVTQMQKSATTRLDTAATSSYLQNTLKMMLPPLIQDDLSSCFKDLLVPRFQTSCEKMLSSAHLSAKKEISENGLFMQQHLANSSYALASKMKDLMDSASLAMVSLKSELIEGHKRILPLAERAIANAAQSSSTGRQNSAERITKGILSQGAEITFEITTELSKMLKESQFEEAFKLALSCGNISIVSWLCLQVDVKKVLAVVPPVLSQGVLFSLVQQLGYDIGGKECAHKLTWIEHALLALNLNDGVWAPHIRLLLEQLYPNLQRHLPFLATNMELSYQVRLVMHLINSMLSS